MSNSRINKHYKKELNKNSGAEIYSDLTEKFNR